MLVFPNAISIPLKVRVLVLWSLLSFAPCGASGFLWATLLYRVAPQRREYLIVNDYLLRARFGVLAST